MKASVILLALLSACSCAGLYRLDIHPAQLEALEDATVAMVEPDGARFRAYCSGVWIGADLIATAAHCVVGANLTPHEKILEEEIGLTPPALGHEVLFASYRDLLKVYDSDDIGLATSGVVVALDEEHDVALVRVSNHEQPHHIAPLARRTMAAGEVGHIVGHPGGELYSYSPAHVAAAREMKAPFGRTYMIQVWSGAWKGNSGGGLFDEGGELQGICSLVMPGSGNAFFVHVKYVQKMVAGL